MAPFAAYVLVCRARGLLSRSVPVVVTAIFPFHMRHHFLDTRPFARRGGRCTSRCREITLATSSRSATWNNERPAEIAMNGFGAAALVHEAGIRLSLPPSW